jgi:hypothetical protein
MSQTVPKINTNLDSGLALLSEILPQIWSCASSGFPGLWTPDNPSCGQCIPTARLVQTLLGGKVILQRLKFVNGVWDHFVNEIDGIRFDLSVDQMAGEVFVVISEKRRTCDDNRILECLRHVRYMVDTLFRDYSRHTSSIVVAQ